MIKNVEKLTSYGKGRTGLSNLGNTCYLNSILQCLSSTSELVEYFLKNNYKNDLIQPDGVAHEFCEILNALWDADQKIISPYKLRNMIGVTNRNFLSNGQQDSHELMIFLLEAIHRELNKVKKYTSIYFYRLSLLYLSVRVQTSPFQMQINTMIAAFIRIF